MMYPLVPIGPPLGKKIPDHWTLASVIIILRNRNRDCKYVRSEDLVSASIFSCIVKDGFACWWFLFLTAIGLYGSCRYKIMVALLAYPRGSEKNNTYLRG